MKRFIRVFVIECVALYLASQIAKGMVFNQGVQGLIITGVALAVATFLIRPVVNILLLPINLLTFGLFKWVAQAITFFLVDLALPQFMILEFNFPGLKSIYLDLPMVAFPHGPLAYLAFSLLISFIAGIIYWIIK